MVLHSEPTKTIIRSSYLINVSTNRKNSLIYVFIIDYDVIFWQLSVLLNVKFLASIESVQFFKEVSNQERENQGQ